MTRIIEVNRCIECPYREHEYDATDQTYVAVCRNPETNGRYIPDIDILSDFCPLKCR